jgi:putative transcriptional regulator
MNIGQRVREFRKDMGMPQAELARRAGVARNYIVMIENGNSTPSVKTLEKIARELRTEPAELLREPVPLDEAPPSEAAGQAKLAEQVAERMHGLTEEVPSGRERLVERVAGVTNKAQEEETIDQLLSLVAEKEREILRLREEVGRLRAKQRV